MDRKQGASNEMQYQDFPVSEAGANGDDRVCVLLKPGHYDFLYRETASKAENSKLETDQQGEKKEESDDDDGGMFDPFGVQGGGEKEEVLAATISKLEKEKAELELKLQQTEAKATALEARLDETYAQAEALESAHLQTQGHLRAESLQRKKLSKEREDLLKKADHLFETAERLESELVKEVATNQRLKKQSTRERSASVVADKRSAELYQTAEKLEAALTHEAAEKKRLQITLARERKAKDNLYSTAERLETTLTREVADKERLYATAEQLETTLTHEVAKKERLYMTAEKLESVLMSREAEVATTREALARTKVTNKALRSQIAELHLQLRTHESDKSSLAARDKKERQALARENAALSHALDDVKAALGVERQKTTRLKKMLQNLKEDQTSAQKRRTLRVQECATELLMFVSNLRSQGKISLGEIGACKELVINFINMDTRAAHGGAY